jgi:hypothetical protein
VVNTILDCPKPDFKVTSFMRLRAVLIFSVALNIAFVAALIAYRHGPFHGVISAGDTPPPGAMTNSAAPRVVVRREFFTWQEVESDNYLVYIHNLREIGCPEQTIRDIIIADVNQLYAKKRQDEIVTADQQWWRYDPDANPGQATPAQIQALEQERRELLNTLLGTNWQNNAGLMSTRSGIVLSGPVLGDLPADTKQALVDIASRSQQRTLDYLAAQKQAGKNADPGELARIRQETRNQLSQILNPTQLEEFLLRYSQSASDLRHELQGFDVTPDEFRKIFRATDSIDQQVALYYSGDSPTAAQQRVTLQKQLDDAIRNNLGPDRYQELVMAKDPAYRDAVLAADDAGASPQAVTNLYAINIAAAQEMDRIRNDPTLTADQKAQALKAVQAQQQAAGDQVLGLAPPTPPAPPFPSSPPSQTFINHSYIPGETLDAIANNYGVSLDALRTANPGTDLSRLQNGAVIRIPRAQATGQ